MCELEERLNQDFLEALKKQEQLKLGVLRLLKAALKNEQIAKRARLTNEEALKVLKREVKKRQEASAMYQAGGRPELASREEEEIGIVKVYLPAALNEAELKDLLAKIIKEESLQGSQNFGQVMKVVMPKLGDQADGSQVSQLIKELLADR